MTETHIFLMGTLYRKGLLLFDLLGKVMVFPEPRATQDKRLSYQFSS